MHEGDAFSVGVCPGIEGVVGEDLVTDVCNGGFYFVRVGDEVVEGLVAGCDAYCIGDLRVKDFCDDS